MTVGKYRLERLIGEGGMGQVYRATHLLLGHPAAVKVLNAEYARRANVVQRFFNEARAAATLRHAGIVDVLDFDTMPDGRPYMVLELLEGEPLSRKLRREGPLAPPALTAILWPVCEAVGSAHKLGIVHRDLKPDNIFLVRRAGAEGQVKVLDFGVAKLLDADASGVSTRSGVVLGTPEYMSPEQAMGDNDLIGPPSDVYSLGIIAYRMLAGRVPFPGENLSLPKMALKHAHEAPPSLKSMRPDVPGKLTKVIHRAIEKKPLDRWPSMEAFGEALRRSLDSDGRRSSHVFAGSEPTATIPLRVGPSAVDRHSAVSSLADATVQNAKPRRFTFVVAMMLGVAAAAVVAVLWNRSHSITVVPLPSPLRSTAPSVMPTAIVVAPEIQDRPVPPSTRVALAPAERPPVAEPSPAIVPSQAPTSSAEHADRVSRSLHPAQTTSHAHGKGGGTGGGHHGTARTLPAPVPVAEEPADVQVVEVPVTPPVPAPAPPPKPAPPPPPVVPPSQIWNE